MAVALSASISQPGTSCACRTAACCRRLCSVVVSGLTGRGLCPGEFDGGGGSDDDGCSGDADGGGGGGGDVVPTRTVMAARVPRAALDAQTVATVAGAEERKAVRKVGSREGAMVMAMDLATVAVVEEWEKGCLAEVEAEGAEIHSASPSQPH